MHEEAKQIPLRKRGKGIVAYALVDPDDFERLGHLRWHTDTNGYARRGAKGGKAPVYLHREVMGLSPGDPPQVDHKNRNLLDCRKTNLRLVTNSQNPENRGAMKGGSSSYRGVSFGTNRMWRAKVETRGVVLLRRCFATELEAAIAAEACRLEHLDFYTADPRLASLLNPEGGA